MRITFLLFLLVIVGCAVQGHTFKHISPAETLKLCLIGDTGSEYKLQKDVALMLEKEKCDSVHFLGDLIYESGLSNSRDEEFQKKFYNYYYKLTEKDSFPRLYIILGNHDHRGSVSAWVEISKKHDHIVFPSPWYLVKMNDLCVVHLDTNYYTKLWRYPAGQSQKDWLKETEEKEMKDCSKRIALMHHPYENRGKSHGPSSGRIRKFQEEFIIGKYDFLIAGHEHILSDEGNKKGTHLLISGAGGKPYPKESAGFLVMNWNTKKKELTYEFRKLSE